MEANEDDDDGSGDAAEGSDSDEEVADEDEDEAANGRQRTEGGWGSTSGGLADDEDEEVDTEYVRRLAREHARRKVWHPRICALYLAGPRSQELLCGMRAGTQGLGEPSMLSAWYARTRGARHGVPGPSPVLCRHRGSCTLQAQKHRQGRLRANDR